MAHRTPTKPLRVLIVAGSPDGVEAEVLRAEQLRADIVIAVDSGGDACVTAGIDVDVLVGDLDSITPAALASLEVSGTRVKRYPTDKDTTDLALALVEAERSGATSVRVLGALGGRPDHELCVWGDLARAARLAPEVVGRAVRIRVLSPHGLSHLRVEGRGRLVSVLPLLSDAVVSARGMRWELDRATLGPLCGRGLSNEVAGEYGEIEVHSGTVAAIIVYDSSRCENPCDFGVDAEKL